MQNDINNLKLLKSSLSTLNEKKKLFEIKL